jgi:hypothetical protein
MNTTEKVVQLFDALISEGEAIKKICKKSYFSGQKKQVSPEAFEEWKTKCLCLLKSTFGSSSPQYDSFANSKFFDYYNSTQIYLGILRAAKSNLEEGYFFHKDLMLSVNIYDSLLLRARKLIENKQLFKAGAILEAVLMEVLTKVCDNKNVPHQEERTIKSLAEILFRIKALPESTKDRLLELHDFFAQTAKIEQDAELQQAADWILSFLNDFLGAQILILN